MEEMEVNVCREAESQDGDEDGDRRSDFKRAARQP